MGQVVLGQDLNKRGFPALLVTTDLFFYLLRFGRENDQSWREGTCVVIADCGTFPLFWVWSAWGCPLRTSMLFVFVTKSIIQRDSLHCPI
jgi:hypothetical protein